MSNKTTELLARIALLEAERDALKARSGPVQGFTMKVGEKGGVVFRGLKGASARFGQTLYPVTVLELFARKAEIEAFIEKNRPALSWSKPVKP